MIWIGFRPLAGHFPRQGSSPLPHPSSASSSPSFPHNRGNLPKQGQGRRKKERWMCKKKGKIREWGEKRKNRGMRRKQKKENEEKEGKRRKSKGMRIKKEK
jgi:hypothetical protein